MTKAVVRLVNPDGTIEDSFRIDLDALTDGSPGEEVIDVMEDEDDCEEPDMSEIPWFDEDWEDDLTDWYDDEEEDEEEPRADPEDAQSKT